MQPDVPPLLVVELLFRAKSAFTDLSHVTTSVSQFLDSSVELPLHKACAFESLRLLDRIWVCAKAYHKNTTDEGGSFSICRCFGTDRYYREYQFNRSLHEAVKRRHLAMVMWLSSRFKGYCIEGQVVTAAASVGAIEMLDFFCKNDNASLIVRARATNTTIQGAVGHPVYWSPDALEVAVLHGHSNVMWWILQHIPGLGYDLNKALECAVLNGDIALAEWLLSNGAAWAAMSQGHNLVHEVAAQGRLDVLMWMEKERGSVANNPGVLLMAAGRGHLEVVRWLLDLDARSCGSHITDLGGEASLAIHTAAVNGYLRVAKYLRARAQTPVTDLQRAEELLEQVIQLRRLTETLGESCTAAKVTIDTVIEAGKNGHADVVQWLWMEYPRFNFGDKQTATKEAPMDTVAAQGHLNVLVVMQASNGADSLKRNRDGSSKGNQICTSKAMDDAAANGHLDVVKWLHENRDEGCTSHAIDDAASGGHLLVIQWLHENYSEIGCTSAAMDGAATNGHLDVVKWLHINTNSGCTTRAMNGAAANGHLHVVQWLHEHRREGCTVIAMNGAAANGHLAVVKWLHRNRSEGCTTSAMDLAPLHIVRWLHTHRSEGCSSYAITSAIIRGDCELLLFFHSQCKQVCTVESAELARSTRNGQMGIFNWILGNYPQFGPPPQE